MKHAAYDSIESVTIDNEAARDVTGRVLIGRADGAENFCMRSFTIGPGGHTPKHSHDWEHEIFVHQGTGDVLLDDQWHALSPGSVVFIPGGIDHQIRNSSGGSLTFICLVPSGAPEM